MSPVADKKPVSPFVWLFHTSLLVLGTVIALRLAVCYLQPIWPWIAGAIGLGVVVWLLVALIRWRRNRW